jgi:hypothetical protein
MDYSIICYLWASVETKLDVLAEMDAEIVKIQTELISENVKNFKINLKTDL